MWCKHRGTPTYSIFFGKRHCGASIGEMAHRALFLSGPRHARRWNNPVPAIV
jgi:hypothetical protein